MATFESICDHIAEKKKPIKNCCTQSWPKNQTAASILIVVSIYTTLLAIVDQASTKEAIKDANNQSIFNINEEIKNVTVSAISYSILWNCRDYSVTNNYYKGYYAALITILFVYILVGMFKLCKFDQCHGGNPKNLIQPVFQVLSDVCLRISLIFLLTSYNIDPWVCFHGPTSITYTEDTQEVDLEFPSSALMYQKGAPFISVFFGLLGWAFGCFVQEEDAKQRQTENPIAVRYNVN